MPYLCLAERVSRRFGPTAALHDVTIEITRPGVHAVVGPSGSGKTTLLNVMSGLDLPDHGRVELDGVRIDQLTARQRLEFRGRRVGFVFQRFNLVPTLTARENIELLCRTRGQRVDSGWLRHLAETVEIADCLHRYPCELSGGEQQRVAIVRAVLPRPTVLFADEPTASLDRLTGLRVFRLLLDLATDAVSVVLLVTHDMRLTDGCASVSSLEDGRISRSGV